jgi:hypothetical protein
MAEDAVSIYLEGDSEAIAEVRRELEGNSDCSGIASGTVENWDGEAQQLASLVVDIASIAIPAITSILTAWITRRRPGEINVLTIDGGKIVMKGGDDKALAALPDVLERAALAKDETKRKG